MSGNQQGRDIGQGGAAEQDTACSGREAHHFFGPFYYLFLNIHGHVVADAHVGVHARRQHIGQHAEGCATSLYPRPKARMGILGIEGQYLCKEMIVDSGGFLRCERAMVVACCRPQKG